MRNSKTQSKQALTRAEKQDRKIIWLTIAGGVLTFVTLYVLPTGIG